MGQFKLDTTAAMFPQVGKLGSEYWQWVHKPSSQRSFRMFKHDFLEYFAATKWWTIPLVWLPVLAYLSSSSMGYASLRTEPYQALAAPVFAAVLATAILFWTLLEYLLHRYLFHVLFSSTSEFFIAFHFLLHGQHHKFPLDEGRLVFPPVSGFMVAFPFYVLFHATLPFAVAESMMAGTVAGYVAYDLTHYYLHYGKPTLGYLKDLKRYHREHHYRNPDMGFGISSKLWDYPFQTLPPKAA
eukprot:m.56559 g.56559  ORF g.56559 m.56559 type:complete len:241 (-) comp13689_c0_seq2:1156-1878(-)